MRGPGSSFITSHTAAPWSQTAKTHGDDSERKACVCVCFFFCHSAWPGVGEAPQLRPRLSVWHTAHCGIWRDSSLAAHTCRPGLTRYTRPILAFTESHISGFLLLYLDLMVVKKQKGVPTSVRVPGRSGQVGRKTAGPWTIFTGLIFYFMNQL